MRFIGSELVGRAAQLGTIESALDRTRKNRGGALFLTGEAGIGKSRLARETISLASAADMRVLRGRAGHAGVTVPFGPLTEALLELFRAGGPPDHPDLVPYRPSLGLLIPDWREGTPPAGADSLVILAEAVLRLLVLTSGKQGCLVVLDDLHDADPETLAVVDYLADHLERQPVLLVGTTRLEASPAYDLVCAAGRRQAATVLQLDPLKDRDVVRLVASALRVPASEVPAVAIDRLCRDTGGNPLLVEELLSGMVACGALNRVNGGWQIDAELNVPVPSSLVQSVADRADRLGARAREVLCAAAVLGRRFPLDVLQAMTGLSDPELTHCLHRAAAAQLVVPDERSRDWYAFRHALTVEALLACMGTISRRRLARVAAETIERMHADLPGDWCQIAAGLRLAAGDSWAAGRLLATAGHRALADGAANSAVDLLEHANDLLSSSTSAADRSLRADVLESLIFSLVEAGQLDRALTMAETSDMLSGSLTPERRAALHTEVAWAAAIAGKWTEGMAQVTAARALVDSTKGGDTAAIDVVAGYLAMYAPDPNRLQTAEELASRALAGDPSSSSAVVACRAWQLLGILARRRSLDEADTFLRRMAAVAETHDLSIWRIRALVFLAGNHALREGTVDRIVQARDEALRAGAVAAAYGLEASIAFQAVLCGDYGSAVESIDRCSASVVRLYLPDTTFYAILAKAMCAAHRGDRDGMERALGEFRSKGGEETHFLPYEFGLCQAFCALLEEDRATAAAALGRAVSYEEANPTIFHLAGRHGLDLLLRALAGTLTLQDCTERMVAQPSNLRWNRQFALFAYAVLLGRAGKHAEATAAAAAAREVAAPFPMARRLGQRLVAEAAIADGWGDPVAWLRDAEEYFHGAGVPAVASACRGLLRQAGAVVQRRRRGSERIPDQLRRLGVTTREYEVLELIANRLGNKEIADRLYISPRTVEKHVASLLTKTGNGNRAALRGYAVRLPGLTSQARG